ncbi:hypothetical protein PS922_02136 [Pseudomonas fluorescens]|uniref:Uncharacterized protein n=1 Tax=Pseudomonas fluorescens TaxID=294 RepID=A0A5E7SES9_PSEFL|nr:hypothetical protein PS922_02136 [Pseudomonas fluorescens]
MRRPIPVPAGNVPPVGGHTKGGYLPTSTQLKVNNYPAEIIDGQAFIATFSEESAP